ncbi:DNA translocase FtsK 4TM domain-containing protein [uncultured Psychromonas sp.]|uniref:DNA translocase FtsK 4TM domain-containing protein n=1 Tax=uncultured Psychromonas sp. TaxID=173974 RepID=UPI00261F31C3|nr:DNA translocase FtsK 4TM domain-containing protein [uncultured Psychromonas sp.]
MSNSKLLNHLSGVQKLLEVGIIVSAFVAIFITLSLFTFSPVDPSWSQQQWVAEIQNSGGRVGAWIADILFYGFGFLAYLIPVIIVSFTWAILWKPTFSLDVDFLNLSLRIVGFIFTFFSLSALIALNVSDYLYYPSGGLIGDILAQSMLGFFSLVAVNLILLTFLISGTTLLFGFSWIRLIDGIGEHTLNGISWLANLPNNLKKMKEDRSDDDQQRLLDKQQMLQEKLEKKQQKQAMKEQKKLDNLASKVTNEDNDAFLSEQTDDSDDAFLGTSFIDEPNEDEVELNIDDIDWQSDDASDQEFEPIAAEPKVEKKLAKVDFSHLPEHARPVERFVADQNIAPLPHIDLLDRPDKKENPISQQELDTAARLVESKLLEFKIKADVVNVLPGPVITRFELDLAPGMKVSTVSSLEKDLARALSAMSVRVVDQIPGKSVIALELPNRHREIVYISEVLDCKRFHESKSPLTMVLGADISGQPVVVDLAKMPHLLVAGTTGSGKSVGVNCMLVSLLYKSSPEDLRMILIDPKMLELNVYEGIPHLLTEVVTDMKDAANALRWCVGEMERRYKLLAEIGVRNLAGYNTAIKKAKAAGEPIVDPLWKPGDSMAESAPELEKLPTIVVVVDEFADMMMIVGKKCEELITRIAQKARAAGIHLILATQRPSVDVITGLIKANIPTRIAFQVSSKIDSRTILGQQGAETLLGHGDMLYMPPGVGVPTRVHGAFVDDHEVHKVVADWKKRGQPNYVQEILAGDADLDMLLPGEQAEGDEEIDPLFDEVVSFITETRKVSISSIQRRFRIGYNRSARLVDQLQAQGVISAPSGANSNRDVLAPPPIKD